MSRNTAEQVLFRYKRHQSRVIPSVWCVVDHHRCNDCSASLTEKEEEEEKRRKVDENRVLPGCRFANLALLSGDIDIFVGQGSDRK